MPSLRIIRCSIQPVPSTTLSTGLPAEYVMSVADMSLSLTVLARESYFATYEMAKLTYGGTSDALMSLTSSVPVAVARTFTALDRLSAGNDAAVTDAAGGSPVAMVTHSVAPAEIHPLTLTTPARENGP